MPTDKTERRITFTPTEVLSALKLTFKDDFPTGQPHIQAKIDGGGLFHQRGDRYVELTATERPLHTLILVYDE